MPGQVAVVQPHSRVVQLESDRQVAASHERRCVSKRWGSGVEGRSATGALAVLLKLAKDPRVLAVQVDLVIDSDRIGAMDYEHGRFRLHSLAQRQEYGWLWISPRFPMAYDLMTSVFCASTDTMTDVSVGEDGLVSDVLQRRVGPVKHKSAGVERAREDWRKVSGDKVTVQYLRGNSRHVHNIKRQI